MVSAVVLWLAIGVFVSITLCIQEDICDLQGSLYMKRGGGKGGNIINTYGQASLEVWHIWNGVVAKGVVVKGVER